MILSKNQQKLVMILFSTWSLTACGTFARREDASETGDAAPVPPVLAQKMAEKDAEVKVLQAQVNELQTELKRRTLETPARPVAIAKPTRQGFDGEPMASVAANDPQKGFVNDSNVQAFRQGKILFDTEKYPEAVLAFSAWLERQPKHALSGVAQFYLAESYFFQNDFEAAQSEYQKVINQYDRSPYVSQSYARAAHCLAQLGDTTTANQMRQKVLAYFPKSQAAHDVSTPFEGLAKSNVTTPTAPTAPAVPQVNAPQVQLEKPEPTQNASALDDVPVTAPESGGI